MSDLPTVDAALARKKKMELLAADELTRLHKNKQVMKELIELYFPDDDEG